MPALVSFPDYVQANAPAYLTEPSKIRAAAMYQRLGWDYLIRGHSAEKMLRHGNDIREKAMFTEDSTFESYGPNDPGTGTNIQNMTTLVAKWRFARDNQTWTEEELAEAGAGAGADALPQIYFDYKAKLEQRFAVSAGNGLERKFIAVPDKTTMEADAGSEPYPLHAFINDHPNTLFNNPSTGTWTTVMGVSPTAATSLRHKNRMFGYSSKTANPTDDAQNMLNALDSAYTALGYVSPAASQFYRAPAKWEDSGWPNKVLMLSQKGMDRMTSILRGRNDVWTNPSQAGLTGQMYNGHEFVPLPRLDEIAAYLDNASTALVQEGSATGLGTGPRIFIVDTQSYNAVFRRGKFFEFKDPRWHPFQPTTWTVWCILHYQFVCPHRWTCGIVTPGTVAGDFPSEVLTGADVYTAWQT